jgi:hypothetical protein
MSAPLTVASFYVHRPDHPRHGESDFAGMLRVLDASCKRLGLHHVVLTDFASTDRIPMGVGYSPMPLPEELMQATTEAHAQFLDGRPGCDVLFVGADSILLRHPSRFVPSDADLCFTYRPGHLRYPINNGFMYVNARAREGAALFFREVADRCGGRWGDDQRAIAGMLEPLPKSYGEIERHGMRIRLLPMLRFNDVPAGPQDKCQGVCLLHFRGRKHKPKFFPWAKAQGFMP